METVFIFLLFIGGLCFFASMAAPRPGPPWRPEMVITNDGISYKGEDIPFAQCRHLFIERTLETYGSQKTTYYKLELTDRERNVLARETVSYSNNRPENEDIDAKEAFVDEILNRWHDSVLPQYEAELKSAGRIIFPARKGDDRSFIELTPSFVSVSSLDGGGRVALGGVTVKYWERGTFHIINSEQSINIDGNTFADLDVLKTLLERYICDPGRFFG